MVLVVAFQGCQFLDGADEPPPRSSISVTALPADTVYPELRTVPARPQLSYSVEQRREIVEGLISDRANARYTSQRIRHRAGLASLPPPPPPNDGDATATTIVGTPETRPETPAAARDVPGGYDGDPVTDRDDGGLNDFMRDLVRETEPFPPAPEAAEPPPAAPGTESPPDEQAAAPQPIRSASTRPVSSQRRNGPAPAATPLFAWIDDVRDGAATAGNEAAVTASATPGAKATARAGVAQAAALRAVTPAAATSDPSAAPGDGAIEVAALETGAVTPASLPEQGASTDAARAPEAAVGTVIPSADLAVRAPSPVLKPAPNPAASGSRAVPALPGEALATVEFAAGSAELPAAAVPTLEEVLAAIKGDGVIEVVGQGEAMGLALDRARAVALALMRLGAGAGDLRLAGETSPAADRVRLVAGARPAR